MCLIVFAIDSHKHYPFVLAANRDELYARSTRTMRPWPEAPQLFAGKDLKGGGTWLGITHDYRFAAVTSVREGIPNNARQNSRGELTRNFLLGVETAENYSRDAYKKGENYAGFNLLVGDKNGIFYCSNRGEAPRALKRGIYGLSNSTLDVPWPKVAGSKEELQKLLQNEPSLDSLMKILSDAQQSPDSVLPDTGVGLKLERMLSARFVASPTYGTRASTALLIGSDGDIQICEQNFGSNGIPIGERIFYHWNYLD